MLSPSSIELERGWVVWITGLPSSGKSTLAESIRQRLLEKGTPCCVLDGDAVRAALVPTPGYTPEARDAFYATLARLAAQLADQGLVVLVPATAHRRLYRVEARALAPRYLEVFVAADASACAERDAKGLYAARRDGQIDGLPGADLRYEMPDEPDLVATGGRDADVVAAVVARVAGGAPFPPVQRR